MRQSAQKLQKTNSRTICTSENFINISANCNKSKIPCKVLPQLFLLVLHVPSTTLAAPYNATNSSSSISAPTLSENHAAAAWPPMRHIDIWSAAAQTTASDAVEPQIADIDNSDWAQDELQLITADAAFQYAPKSGVNMHDDLSKPNFKAAPSTINRNNTLINRPRNRHNRVIHLFPVPVDGECLSDDGRRIGNCFNPYECRAKGGAAKGECAMGFGVCCIFIAACNTTIGNNITYMVSPQFPSFMPNNYTAPCNIKVQLMNNEISQLRIDFYHFSLGQPNRRTGICDGDVFNISGGPSGPLLLCGQNSGQHIYYEVGGAAAPRQTLYGNLRPLTYSQLYPNNNASLAPMIDITMNFTQRFQPIRLWEIRISQIPFSQRAPVGCLQYYTGSEGIIQTFNFAENGRHLANQDYRICMRQEADMCSIMYQPCDEQSFRIGPSRRRAAAGPAFGGGLGMDGIMGMPAPIMLMDPMLGGGIMNGLLGDGNVTPATGNPMTDAMPSTLADDPNAQQTMDTMASSASTTAEPTVASSTSSTAAMDIASSTATSGGSSDMAGGSQMPEATMPGVTMSSMSPAASSSMTTSAASPAAPETSAASSEAPPATSSATTLDTRSSTTAATPSSTTPSSAIEDDELTDEGSGEGSLSPGGGIRRPTRPPRGGFDLLGFLRSAFEFTGFRRNGRQIDARQLYTRCTDRLTMPCIVEDFIGLGPLGTPALPGCEPVHCGAQFCSSGMWPCRVESTVTPFYIGVHFGNGAGKGSAEENIGACLRYQQVQCV